MDKMAIYNALPICGQNLACYYEGKKIVRSRYGKMFWDKLSEYEDRSTWSYEQLCEYRDKELKRLILHAYNTVPYYKRIFDEGGINPESITCLDDLKMIPVLTKDIIKKEPESFISSMFQSKDMVTAHTSGTTGNGFIFKTTNEALCDQWAVWWRYRRALGISFDELCALFGGRSVVPVRQTRPPYFRWNKPCNQMYFSIYHMNDKTLDYYIDEINKRDVAWIHGYPSAISIIADYIINKKVSMNVKFITTGAENLLESQKDKIKLAFGNDPFQHYGLSEATANFSENNEHGMVVDEDFAAVEFWDNGSGSNDIIGTSLTNYAMPFIRYKTGDVCNLHETTEGRIITSLDGRKEDYLILADGTKIGRLDHIFKDVINVREAQFAQKEPGMAELRIVKGPCYTDDDENRLRHEIDSRLNKIDIRFVYVNEIKKTETGKLRFVVSE